MQNATIVEVIMGSCAETAGIRKGDRLLNINEKAIHDIIDYLYLSSKNDLLIEVARSEKLLKFHIEKTEEEILGLRFDGEIFDELKLCRNRCRFCFVDQVPPQLRDTLKLKDDDYRLSFLHGNFITLSNLEGEDWKKIREYRLSPLYVSIHTTNPGLRSRIFRNREAAHIRDQLKVLFECGITLHAQIVLCPGINDGNELESTIIDLAGFFPSVASIAIVPVGVTRYFPEQSVIHPLSLEARTLLIEQVAAWKKQFKKRYGDSLVYLSDEFYLKTKTEIPRHGYYGEFPQMENGVGMMRKFLTGYNRGKGHLPRKIKPGKRVRVVTGILAYETMQSIISDFNRIEGLEVQLAPVRNTFWGERVDVAGLLTGYDILCRLKEEEHADVSLIPSVCLKEDHIFLDDLTINDLEKELGSPVLPVNPSYSDLRKKILS